MITTVTGLTINELFYQLLDRTAEWQPEQRRDGKATIDSPGPVVAELRCPRARVLTVPGRNSSLPAACAETLWVLAGRSDLEFLRYYLPRAGDFSDDNGVTWRAAYGPRLRGITDESDHDWVTWRCDQLRQIVYHLRSDKQSRRASMTLLEPKNDFQDFRVRDFPCTQSLSFMPREGKLDLVVFIRSNDLLWGWSGINIFEFTVLHELVSLMTGIPLGTYYHVSNSLHYYTEFEKRFVAMRAAPRFDVYPAVGGALVDLPRNPLLDVRDLDRVLKGFFDVESKLRHRNLAGGDGVVVDWIDAHSVTPVMLKDMFRVVLAACLLINSRQSYVTDRLIGSIQDLAVQVGMLEWTRRSFEYRLSGARHDALAPVAVDYIEGRYSRCQNLAR